MKKIFFAILGAMFIFASCQENSLPQIEQNPYRVIVEYTPQTVEMDVKGTLTPVEDYSSWLTMTQSGDKATFTLRRNTTGKIRRAEFKMSGSDFVAAVNQKAHSLDGKVATTLASQGLGFVSVNSALSTSYTDDYASWGVAYNTKNDVSSAKDVPQTGTPGKTTAKVEGLEDGVDYFFWTYVVSTEGDKIYSDVLAVIPPVYFKEGENLQTVLENAKEYAEIRVPGGITISNQTIKFSNSCKNKKISGGWNADYSEQSMDNLTVLDLNYAGYGFWCAGDDSFGPLEGSAEVSYFEITRCKGDHGSAVRACGGPVTVHHCYVHDNDCEKGAIGTKEEEYSTDITVYNCIVANNIGHGHGAAFGFGDGASDDDMGLETLVNNLIIDNFSTQYDGYCSVAIVYNKTEIVMVNNTLVGNGNYEEYGCSSSDYNPATAVKYAHEYPGLNMRGDVRSLYANNIMVGNLESLDSTPANYYRQNKFMGFGGGYGTFAYNIYEGVINDSAHATISDNLQIEVGADYSDIIDSNYKPQSKAIGFGTLGTLSYRGSKDSSPKTCNISELLEKYNTDLAGNPRVVDGKVSAGCYQ